MPSLRTPLSTKKWSRVSVNTDLCVGTLRRALSQIEENIRGELKVLTEIGKIPFDQYIKEAFNKISPIVFCLDCLMMCCLFSYRTHKNARVQR